jgi:ribonuclease R
MLLANETVATYLETQEAPALYRIHEEPDTLKIAKFEEFISGFGYSLGAPVNALRPRHFQKLIEKIHGKPEEKPIAMLMLRTMQKARYAPANQGHFGLASPSYTHFTSPIRRYPDLVVHRALLRELGVADDPVPGDLGHLAEHLSVREREAGQLEYLADDICLAWLLEQRLFERGWEEPFEGEVTGMIGSGLFVRFGTVFEGFLPARRLHGEFYELNDLATALVGRRSGKGYRLGDPIAVRVESIARNEGKVELALG